MSSSRTDKKQSRYHHGDLRHGLIERGRSSLKEGGVAKLSLRAVAADLGVSHAAAYHHFKNKDDLLTAIAVATFAELERYQRKILEKPYKDSIKRLQALAAAYIDFALSYPDEFRLMFSPQLRSDKVRTEVEEAGRRVYQLLIGAVQDIKDEGTVLSTDVEQAAISLWTCVHGLASLILDGPLYRNAKTERGRKNLVSTSITTALYGILTPD